MHFSDERSLIEYIVRSALQMLVFGYPRSDYHFGNPVMSYKDLTHTTIRLFTDPMLAALD